jgi:hypothetical protein
MARTKKESVTIQATGWELERWRNAACSMRRDLNGFLAFAANATVRYFQELDRQRSPDAVITREAEKRRLGALLKAARQAVQYLPKVIERPVHGPLYLQKDLRQAVEAIDDFLRHYGEEYPSE